MFKWVGPREHPMEYLERYLAEPQWVHAAYVLPLVAWQLRSGHGIAEHEIPDRAADHLIWSLRAWSAFRGSGSFEDKAARFRAQLPKLVRGVAAAIGKTHANRLADVGTPAVSQFAEDLERAFLAMARDVKENMSFVLPSKAAHLVFPSMIPAFDMEVVRDMVLEDLLPPRIAYRKSFATWLRLCCCVLQEFKSDGTLAEAGRMVRDALLGDWAMEQLQPAHPPRTDAVLPLLDSFVAEYTLIGIQRAGGIQAHPL